MVSVLIALAIASFLVWFRPLDSWMGSITQRANETKVPRNVVLALELMSMFWSMVVAFGFPSSFLMIRPNHIAALLGFKDILSELIFWFMMMVFGYLIVRVVTIVVSTVWSFFGFTSLRLYATGGWRSFVTYAVICGVVLTTIVGAMNLLMSMSLAGLMSLIPTKVQYDGLGVFVTIFNVVLVINGILSSPTQGQYLADYFSKMYHAKVVSDETLIIRRALEQHQSTHLNLLNDMPPDYVEPDIKGLRDARDFLGKINPKAVALAPYVRVSPDGRDVGLAPEVQGIVVADEDGGVDLRNITRRR